MTEFVNNREETTDDRICEHLWLKKAGSEYRANPAEICAKCDTVRRYCPKCGEKLEEND